MYPPAPVLCVEADSCPPLAREIEGAVIWISPALPEPNVSLDIIPLSKTKGALLLIVMFPEPIAPEELIEPFEFTLYVSVETSYC